MRSRAAALRQKRHCETRGVAGYPRPLTAREREVLDALLSADFPQHEAYRAQVEAIEVVGGCTRCPCPSVDLRVDRSRATAAPEKDVAGHRPLPVNADGPGCDLMVFQDNGWLDSLEYVVHDAEGAPVTELPAAHELDVYTLPITG